MNKQDLINFITPQPIQPVEPFFTGESQHRIAITKEATRDYCLRMEDRRPQTFTDQNMRRWYFMDLEKGGNPEGLKRMTEKTETVSAVIVKDTIRNNQISDRSLYGCPRFRPYL